LAPWVRVPHPRVSTPFEPADREGAIAMAEPPRTLFETVAAHAASRPYAPALRGPGGVLDQASLVLAARRLAAGFAAQGLGRGDTIAVQLPNSPEFVVTLLAANALGVVVQTVHMTYRRAELGPLLAHGRACAFVGLSRTRDAEPVATVLSLRDAPGRPLPALRTVVHVGEPVPGAADWSALAAHAPATALPAVRADDPYVLLFTSGTTASPKGVPTTGRRFLGNASDAVAELGFGPGDVILSAAAFTHLYGLFVLQCAAAGVLADRAGGDGAPGPGDRDLLGPSALQAAARPGRAARGGLRRRAAGVPVGHHGAPRPRPGDRGPPAGLRGDPAVGHERAAGRRLRATDGSPRDAARQRRTGGARDRAEGGRRSRRAGARAG
jgi:hypothetical protein